MLGGGPDRSAPHTSSTSSSATPSFFLHNMSDHPASTRPQAQDTRERLHRSSQERPDGRENRVAQWVERVDDLAQESRPLPPQRTQKATLEIASSSEDMDSRQITLPQYPGQVRLRDAQPGAHRPSLQSPQAGPSHITGTPAAGEWSIQAPAGHSPPKALSTRRLHPLAHHPNKTHQKTSSIPLQDLRGSMRTEQSSSNDDTTDLPVGKPPAIPHRSPHRSSLRTDGTASRPDSNGKKSSFMDAGMNSVLNLVPTLPGSASRPLSVDSTGKASDTSSRAEQPNQQDLVSDAAPRVPVLPSRNPRRGATSNVTASTSRHGQPGIKRSGKAPARSSQPLVAQQDSQHGSAFQAKLPNVISSASPTRHGAVHTPNLGPRSTSVTRGTPRADTGRWGLQNGPPVTIMGRETDSGGSSTGSTGTSSNPSTVGQKSSVSGRTKASSISSTKERKEAMESLKCIRSDVMVNYLYQQALTKSYVSALDLWQGIVLKEKRGKYSCCPPQLSIFENGLVDNVKKMNVCCAMTVSTPVTRTILESTAYVELDHVPMPNGLRVQVLKTMSDLPRCQIHHFAAFLEDLMILVVWDDDPEHLLQRAEDLEAKFVKMIWVNREEQAEDDEKEDPKALADEGVEAVDPGKLEAGTAGQEERPVMFVSSIIVALTVCLAVTCMGFGWRRLAMECKVDKNFLRLALLLLAPVQLFFSMFFFQAVCGNIIQMIGPTRPMKSNSKYYSGKAPKKLDRRDCLPHVTIQMPVYKEGTKAVIRPTVMSVKTAISHYEMQGGTANIFVNDDGMQLLGEEDAQERRDFYDEHQIGWVARPRHDPYGERPFVRRGKFKKASNMNYAMSVSRRVEDKLHHVSRDEDWTDLEEHYEYQNALAAVLEEDKGRTWAEGNIRMGDYILLIDCDTRVPKECFLNGVSEMEQAPQVAVLQFTSGVLNVTTSFFERGITWFTNLIYTAITYAVSTGDVCPFVGHNALMRWSAIQTAAAFEDEDGYEKYWSESHVSEDFDMSLRLQCAGYSLRYAAYTGDGFKEGVSLTVYDELARWEKYAYGCNELLFHPFRYWLTRSPFTPLFRQFVTARQIPLPKKITICSYIGTYYAIGSAWLLTVTNYLLTGWGFGLYEKYYADSFSILFSVIMVFTGLGNLSLAVLRYRLKRGSLVGNYLDNAKWIPMLTIYLGGVSLHVSQAILSHFFEIEMNWGATSKELRDVSFHEELGNVLKKFKGTFLFCLASTLVILLGYWVVPYQWQIRDFASIFPFAMLVGCHFLLPIVLNPALIMLSW